MAASAQRSGLAADDAGLGSQASAATQTNAQGPHFLCG